MYEDGYLTFSSSEEQETEKNTQGVQCTGQRWSYSTGKFKNGAVGLCNIGVTGGLNSLLQTLYMNRDFTGILCGMGGPHDSVPRERRFPHELFALFEEMQNTKEDAVPPYRVLRCLQILDVRLCVQYDIADLFFTLWNLLIQQMPESHLVDKLKDLFIIQLKDSVTCRKCYQQRSTDSDLLTISVPVSASRHHAKLPLEYALRKFFKTKELNGDHKRFCPKCGENTPSLKGMQLLSLPRTLTIHLKRLRHQKSTQIQKINRAVSFPPFLDLSDVLDADHLPDEDSAQSHYTYRLFAVVAHSGTASSGYYCAYINSSKDNKWYCFNDSSVCKVSWDDVKCTYGNTTFSWGVTACLLMYVKADLE
ncbi:ubl carboxyl-terminal hydrolase 18 isoform 2-T2 [Discoglossus pictus]